jgi:hypothetical protein
MLPKFRSFVHSIVRPFVHSSYSSFIVRSSSLFIVHRSFIRLFTSVFMVTIHRYYLLLLFIDDIYNIFSSSLFIITIHRSSDRPKFQLLIHHAVQSTLDQPDPYSSHTNSGDCDFPSSRELPIWSPIPGFSKLSTLNFEIPSN